eukprot:7574035-Pyramimonas_sp.AAC.1
MPPRRITQHSSSDPPPQGPKHPHKRNNRATATNCTTQFCFEGSKRATATRPLAHGPGAVAGWAEGSLTNSRCKFAAAAAVPNI